MKKKTMKAVAYAAPNKFELRDVPVPELTPNKIMIQFDYCAICATDVHIVTQGLYNLPVGVLLGHEASATIIEMGPDTGASGFKIGDKVTVWPRKVCGTCTYCKKGMPQYCQNEIQFPTMTEFAAADPSCLFKIPDDADLKAYALMEPGTCTMRAMDLAGIKTGDTVLLSGCGGIGVILLDMIIASGAAKVTVVDPVPEKRELALKMGAVNVIDPFHEDTRERAMVITGGIGFDHVFEASGSPKAAEPCPDIIARCGQIFYFAVYPMDYKLSLNLYELYLKEGSLHTVFTDRYTIPRVIDYIPRMQTDKIIGKVAGLKDAVHAIEVDFKESRYPKILIDCHDV